MPASTKTLTCDQVGVERGRASLKIRLRRGEVASLDYRVEHKLGRMSEKAKTIKQQIRLATVGSPSRVLRNVGNGSHTLKG